jgi:hypothetical protein
MLGIETQHQLRQFFQAVAVGELVARLSDFEPFAAFQRVNRKGDNRITALELYSYLK